MTCLSKERRCLASGLNIYLRGLVGWAVFTECVALALAERKKKNMKYIYNNNTMTHLQAFWCMPGSDKGFAPCTVI